MAVVCLKWKDINLTGKLYWNNNFSMAGCRPVHLQPVMEKELITLQNRKGIANVSS